MPGSKFKSVGAITWMGAPSGRSKDFSMPRLDDRFRGLRSRGGSCGGGRRSGGLLARQFVHQAAVDFLGQLLDEPNAVVGIHLVDNCDHLGRRAGTQQHVGVVIRKLAQQFGGKLRRHAAENGALILEGDVDQCVGGHGRVEALQKLGRLLRASAGENRAKLVCRWGIHPRAKYLL
jgi:hypothetical protein